MFEVNYQCNRCGYLEEEKNRHAHMLCWKCGQTDSDFTAVKVQWVAEKRKHWWNILPDLKKVVIGPIDT